MRKAHLRTDGLGIVGRDDTPVEPCRIQRMGYGHHPGVVADSSHCFNAKAAIYIFKRDVQAVVTSRQYNRVMAGKSTKHNACQYTKGGRNDLADFPIFSRQKALAS